MEENEKLRRRLASLAHFTDDSISLPGGYRIGWDGIIGLIPWVGDIVGLIMSSYLIHASAKLGASKRLLLRMSANAVTETLIGSIPVIGDLFDLAFKANRRNYELLERHIDSPKKTERASTLWLFAVGTTIVLILLTLIFFLVRIVSWAWQLVF